MAEGGSQNDNGNPFSFQSFVMKKDTSPEECRQKTGGEEVADIFDLPDISCSTQRRTDMIEESGDPKPRNKSEKKEKNPFSFKKFIAGGGARPKMKGGPDVACDLPDFITGHLNDEASPKRARAQPHSALPDFTLTSPDIQANIAYDPTPPTRVLPNDLIHTDATYHNSNGHCNSVFDGDNATPDDWMDTSGPHLVSSLPDFLSDAAIVSDDVASCKPVSNVFHHSRDGNCNSSDIDLDTLRRNNQELRETLQEQRRENSTLSKTLSEKCKDLELLQKHEAEETKALGDMVQQVEANLVTTTHRAVQAESTVTKLKQEIRSLQNQLSEVTIENEDLRCGDTTISSIKERTQYAASTLQKAATTAEKQLKDMLSGVESLKMLADVLASIDKVREPSPVPSTSAGAEGGQL